MNTTTAAQTATTTVPAGKRRAARILGALAIMFAGLISVGATAAPAEAAGTVSVRFCAYWNNSGAPAQQLPVTLKLNNGSSWVNYRSGTTGNGCATFYNVPAGYWTYVSMNYYANCYTAYGVSEYMVKPAAGTTGNAGRLFVKSYRNC